MSVFEDAFKRRLAEQPVPAPEVATLSVGDSLSTPEIAAARQPQPTDECDVDGCAHLYTRHTGEDGACTKCGCIGFLLAPSDEEREAQAAAQAEREAAEKALAEAIANAPKAPSLLECVRFLSRQDPDRAGILNGVGWNGRDSEYGHWLAARSEDYWTAKDRYYAYRLIQKYVRTQLVPAGLRADLIEPPVAPWDAEEEVLKVYESVQQGQGYVMEMRGLPQITYRTIQSSIQEIPGKAWLNGNLILVPRDAPALKAMLLVADKHGFTIEEELRNQIAAVVDVADRMLVAATAKSLAEIDGLDYQIKEGLGGELRPFQAADVYYMDLATRLSRSTNGQQGHGILMGNEMGLGKTIALLAFLHQTMSEEDWARGALIIVPASLKINWVREAEKWLPGRKVVMLAGGYAQEIGHAELVIANYDILRYATNKVSGAYEMNNLLFILRMRNWYAVVCDESHYLKSEDAMRTRAVLDIVFDTHPPIRVLMSGSPWLNRANEIIPQGQVLGLIDVPDRKIVGKEFGSPYNFEVMARLHPKAMNLKFREKGYRRLEKVDVLKDLPDKQRSVVICAPDITNRPEVTRIEREFKTWLWEQYQADGRSWGDFVRAMKAAMLVQLGKVKYAVAQGKLKGFKEWCDDFLSSGEKLVIFAEHVEIQHQIASWFGGCSVIRGEDDVQLRQWNVDRFMNDPSVQVIVCSIKAGGVGITLTAASNVAFLELGFNPAIHDQAEDRCHRIGQKGSVNSYFYVGDRTVDTKFSMPLIDKKRRFVTAITEGTDIPDDALFGQMLKEYMEEIA